jgi:hypothetical protein
MKLYPEQRLRSHCLIASVTVLLACSLTIGIGCMSIKLVADYDEAIDRSITDFQKTMEKHLTSLERQIGSPAADYNNYTAFYDDAKVALSSVRVRASAQSKNEITLQQIDLLIENLNDLEKMHKEGLNKNDILPLRSAFNQGCTAILKLELEKKRSRNI